MTSLIEQSLTYSVGVDDVSDGKVINSVGVDDVSYGAFEPSEEHGPLTRVHLSNLQSSWWRQTSNKHTSCWGRNADIWSDPARLSGTHRLSTLWVSFVTVWEALSYHSESLSSLFGRHCRTTVHSHSGVNTPWHRQACVPVHERSQSLIQCYFT